MKLQIGSEYTRMDEGTYEFLIEKIDVKEDSAFGNINITVTFATDNGKKHNEYFRLMTGGVTNEITQRILGQLYNAAMNTSLYEQEVELDDIIGRKIIADISHQTYTDKKTNEQKVAAHIKNFQPVAEVVNEPVNTNKALTLDDLFASVK